MHKLCATTCLIFGLLATPAAAIDGEVLITQSKALQGSVTPGDAAGYPVTISQPGSYKLASNLSVGANKVGIHITSHDVTIDFNGFRLHGNAAADVGVVSNLNSITLKNGMISLFKSHGVHGAGPFWMIDSMRIVFNGGNGIYANGQARQWIISNSEIVENGKSGIQSDSATDAFVIRNNLINGNRNNGINVTRAHIEGNMVSSNGVDTHQSGIALKKGAVLGNTITDNGALGVSAGGTIGLGNNTFVANADGSWFGGTYLLHPNVCDRSTC